MHSLREQSLQIRLPVTSPVPEYIGDLSLVETPLINNGPRPKEAESMPRAICDRLIRLDASVDEFFWFNVRKRSINEIDEAQTI
jgi:hypothetical protein